MPQARLHHYGYIDGRGPGWDELVHEVHLTPTSRLAQILQTDRLWVNSLHHQAVERVAEPMQVTGRSSDGVVEVVERPDHPFYCGVQWHPEILFEQDESSRRIFTAFIAASAAYATAPLQAGAVST
jgi:putative glutamine amidotransferase